MKLLALTVAFAALAAAQPLRISKDNPRYLEWEGKPVLLVGSGEHYGAVLNEAFDFKLYLATLEREGINQTRVFTGAYSEVPGAFGIRRNTLAPDAQHRLLPWKRDPATGRYDLTAWEPKFFERLRDFLSEAARRGVFVELTLFSSTYEESMWKHSPFHPANNSNGTKLEDYKLLHTLSDPAITRFQASYVRKIVEETREFDNILYEIQNEPWADQGSVAHIINSYLSEPARSKWPNSVDIPTDASLAWHAEVARWIAAADHPSTRRHLIALNFANFGYPIKSKPAGIDIINFHYNHPEAVLWNLGHRTPIGYDETGFIGREDWKYRRELWRFLLAGGATFSHLDYSFTVGKEDGTDTDPNGPGGGSPALRRQFAAARRFVEASPFTKMNPDSVATLHTRGLFAQAFSGAGHWIVYLTGPGAKTLNLKVPVGSFDFEIFDPIECKTLSRGPVSSNAHGVEIDLPAFERDLVVRLVSRQKK